MKNQLPTLVTVPSALLVYAPGEALSWAALAAVVGDEEAEVPLGQIAAMTDRTERCTRRSIGKLVELGMVSRRTTTREDGGQGANLYRVLR